MYGNDKGKTDKTEMSEEDSKSIYSDFFFSLGTSGSCGVSFGCANPGSERFQGSGRQNRFCWGWCIQFSWKHCSPCGDKSFQKASSKLEKHFGIKTKNDVKACLVSHTQLTFEPYLIKYRSSRWNV